MFQIVGFEKADGKIRVTLETDENTTVLMLRLFTKAAEFAHVLAYRIATESRLDASQKSRPENMARLRRNRAELLKAFREIPGPHGLRMKMLREMCIGDGVEVTNDRLTAQLALAREEERKGKRFAVRRLIKKGKSIREIADALGMPPSTVARISRELGGARKRDARVKRSVLSLAPRSPGPAPSPSPAPDPASIPPGRPETA
jgi:hypothetical protein